MNLYNAAAEFTRLYPIHPDTQPTAGWNMNCALLMARFALAPGGVGWAAAPSGYGNAITVARNSGPLNANAGIAPVGAWHFWDWFVDGHVGVDLTGGGNDVFMASSFLRDSWGEHIGVNSVSGYNAANRSARYLGWSTNYRGGHYNLAAVSLAATSITPLIQQEDDMLIPIIDTNNGKPVAGASWFLTNGLTKRAVATGEDLQSLVDLGLMKWPGDKPNTVLPVQHTLFNSISTV